MACASPQDAKKRHSPPTWLHTFNWVVLWVLGGPRLAHRGLDEWKPWVMYKPNELKVLLSFANGSAFTSAVFITAGYSALFTSPGSINTNGVRWQLVTVCAAALSAMATLHAFLGFVRVTLYTKALQHVLRFEELSKKRKASLLARERESYAPRMWATMVDVVTMISFHWMFRLSMLTILTYYICSRSDGYSPSRWPAVLGISMLTSFVVALEAVAYAAMASTEKSFPTESFPTEDGEDKEDEGDP